MDKKERKKILVLRSRKSQTATAFLKSYGFAFVLLVIMCTIIFYPSLIHWNAGSSSATINKNTIIQPSVSFGPPKNDVFTESGLPAGIQWWVYDAGTSTNTTATAPNTITQSTHNTYI